MTMTGTRSDPLTFSIDGASFEVRRSWPGSRGERIFECRDAAGRVRAALLSPVAGLVVLDHATDRKLPTLQSGGELLVHRAGKRAVERTGRGFVKHLRRGKADGVAAATRTMGRLAAAAGFAVPEVLAADDCSVTVSTVPGRPLLDLSDRDWTRAWERWADLWPRLVTAGPGAGTDGPEPAFGVHDATAEASVVTTWFGHLRTFDAGGLAGDLADELAAVEDRACAELVALSRGTGSAVAEGAADAVPGAEGADAPPVVAHRDLHDGQMLFCAESDRLGILDFDTAVLADRELDLGNLDVHLDLRVDQEALSPERARIARSAIIRAADAVGADAHRMAVYRRAARARLVCVYAFRPQWTGLAARMAGELANAG